MLQVCWCYSDGKQEGTPHLFVLESEKERRKMGKTKVESQNIFTMTTTQLLFLKPVEMFSLLLSRVTFASYCVDGNSVFLEK